MSLNDDLTALGYDVETVKTVPTPKPKVMPKCKVCPRQSVWRIISRRGSKHSYYCAEHGHLEVK